MSKSSSQIYTVGHQTLDVRQSQFQNYVIGKEESSRINMFRSGRINRVYDPVLQVEPHEEVIMRDPIHKVAGNDKSTLSSKYHSTVKQFQEDMDTMKDLEAKRKRLKQELHLLDSSLGDKRTRDMCFMDRSKVSPEAVIPPSSTFAADAKRIEERQAKQRRELWEQQQLPYAHLHTLAPVPEHKHSRAFGADNTSTFTKSYECFVNTDGAAAAAQGAGATSSSSSRDGGEMSAIQRGGSDAASVRRGGTGMGSGSESVVPFQKNVNAYNSRVLAHNELLQPPRPARSTLLLSGLGFKGHCTEHAMVIIRILQSKNL